MAIVIEELYEYKIKTSRQKNTTSTLSDPTSTTKDRAIFSLSKFGFPLCSPIRESSITHTRTILNEQPHVDRKMTLMLC